MSSHQVDAYVVSYQTPKELEAHLDSWRVCPSERVASLTVVLVEPSHHDRRVLVGAHFGERGRGYASHAPLESIIDWDDNIGYNRACNHAPRAVGWSDTIVWMNADTALHPGAMDACVDALWSNDDWGVLGPRQVDLRGRLTAAGIFGTSEQPQHRWWLKDSRRGRGADVRDDAVYVAGSILFTRRATFERLAGCEQWADAGGFWPEVEHYHGDAGVGAHVRGHGLKCVYYGAATMGHRWHASTKVGGRGEQTEGADRAAVKALCAQHGLVYQR